MGGEAPESPPPSVEDVRAALEALDPERVEAAAQLREAIERLELASRLRERAAELRAQGESAPELLEQLRAELAGPAPEPELEVPEGATLEELEQRRAEAASRLEAARQRLSELQAESTRRQERRDKIAAALSEANNRVAALEERVAALGSGAVAGGVPIDPEFTLARSRLAAARAEVEALRAEVASYEARRELLPARIDRATRRVAAAESRAAAWQSIVAERRREAAQEAADAAERARREAALRDPALQAYAAETLRLAERRAGDDGLPRKIASRSRELAGVDSTLAELRERYASVRRRIEVAGVNRATGLLLRREFESLPEIASLRARAREVRRELADAEFRLIELRDRRAEAGNIDAVVDRLLAGDDFATNEEARRAARELVTARRDLLDETVNEAARYREILIDLDRRTRVLLEAASAYESFIRERILWVRSVPETEVSFSRRLLEAVGPFADAGLWARAWRGTWAYAAERAAVTVPATLGLLGLFVLSRASRRRLSDLAERVSSYRTDAFGHTVAAVWLTALTSAPLAATVWLTGWLLSRPPAQPAEAAAMGQGLMAAGVVIYPLLALRLALQPDGLGGAHFRWPSPTLVQVRGVLVWFIPAAGAVAAIVTAADLLSQEGAVDTVGRLSFTAGMVVLAAALHRVFRPSGALLAELSREHRGGWLERLRYLWYAFLLALPVGLTTLAWLGYFYTAMQIGGRFQQTLVLGLVLLLAYALLARWLFIARRRVALEDARRKREQAAAEAQSGGPPENAPVEGVPVAAEEEELDLPAMSAQTRQLFRTGIAAGAVVGLFAIWADVLPALRMLDRVEVIPRVRVIETEDDGTIQVLEPQRADRFESGGLAATGGPGAGGAAAEGGGPGGVAEPFGPIPTQGLFGRGGAGGAAEPPGGGAAASPDAGDAGALSITLADIGLAVVILVATVIAFRNVPGLFEIVVLQRLPLEAGSRYALTTVLRYLIAIVGVVAAFGAVEVSWSRVQWLAAALTFGLAFGLQEIFANFVSGLIILAERPIRVGDTVTVSNVNGTVSRIRMRATTITDWDRKELVIPNKTFITSDVVNWTLTDSTMRLIIPVGLSYSADVKLAERTLVSIARAHPNIMREPAPYVLFQEFGESTLNFELRVFLPHIDYWLSVKHDLHMKITDAFRRLGIEIAFPQRDLHVRSIGDLEKLAPAGRGDGTPARDPLPAPDGPAGGR